MELWNVYWPGPCIYDINDGLCENRDKLCIHIPIFETVFDTTQPFHPNKVFFVSYNDKQEVEPMHLSYKALNDYVFNESVYRYVVKRAKVYTSLRPLY